MYNKRLNSAAPDHGGDRGVHAGRVPATREHGNPFHDLLPRRAPLWSIPSPPLSPGFVLSSRPGCTYHAPNGRRCQKTVYPSRQRGDRTYRRYRRYRRCRGCTRCREGFTDSAPPPCAGPDPSSGNRRTSRSWSPGRRPRTLSVRSRRVGRRGRPGGPS